MPTPETEIEAPSAEVTGAIATVVAPEYRKILNFAIAGLAAAGGLFWAGGWARAEVVKTANEQIEHYASSVVAARTKETDQVADHERRLTEIEASVQQTHDAVLRMEGKLDSALRRSDAPQR